MDKHAHLNPGTTFLMLRLLLPAAATLHASATTNFVFNGGFESASAPYVSHFIPGWMSYGLSAARAKVTSAERHDGAQSLQMAYPYEFCYGIDDLSIPIAPDSDYVLSFWAKGVAADPRVQAGPPGWDLLIVPGLHTTNTFDWTRFEVALPAADRPAGTRELWLALGAIVARTGGYVCFDDVCLQAVGTTQNLIPNPSFEEPFSEVVQVPGWVTDLSQNYGSATEGASVVAVDRSVFREGAAALCVTGNHTRVRLTQTVNLQALRDRGVKRVRVSAWGKCTAMGINRAEVQVSRLPGGDVRVLRLTGETDWTYGEVVVALGSSDPMITLWAPYPTTGVFWLDDIRVEEAAQEETVNLLRNSDFVRSSSHARLPDFWGVWGNATYTVTNWTLANFGIDEQTGSPVAGARVLKMWYPPKDLIVPVPPSQDISFYVRAGLGSDLSAGLYTFSVYLKAATNGTRLKVMHPSQGTAASWSLGTNWARYVCTTSNVPALGWFYLPDATSTVWMAAPQLEAGTNATGYRPAPETVTSMSVPSGNLLPDAPLAVYTEFDFHTGDTQARVKVRWARDQAATIRARLLETATGSVINPALAEIALSGAGEGDFAIPLATLSTGAYDIVVTAWTNGQEAATAQDRLTKLPPQAIEVRLSRFTRGMVVNGQPFLPVFLPLFPNVLGDWHLGQIKEAGFNALCAGVCSWSFQEIIDHGALHPATASNIRAQLDRLQSLGLKFLWPLSWSCSDWGQSKALFNGDINLFANALATVVNTFKDHPAIIGWYLVDEPSPWNWEHGLGWKEADLRALHDAVRRADPYRPAYVNWNHSWKTEPYGGLACTDMVSHDDYGASAEPFDRELLVPSVRMLNDQRAGRKPGFGWISGSYNESGITPGLDTVRVNAWLHLVYGSRGLGYWSQRPMNPDVWAVMRAFNGEAVYLNTHAFGPASSRVLALAVHNERIHYAIWENSGRIYLFGVNTADAPVSMSLDVVRLTGRVLTNAQRLFDAGAVDLTQGVLHDEFPACQRRAYVFDVQNPGTLMIMGDNRDGGIPAAVGNVGLQTCASWE